MAGIPISRAIMPNMAMLAIMTSFALITSYLSGIDGSSLILAYLVPTLYVAIVAVVLWAGFMLVRLAVQRADRPAAQIVSRLRAAFPMLLLPAVIQPLFLAAFTTAKTAIAPLTSFSWDARFAQWDALIFGTDPWRLTFGLIGVEGSRALEIFYTAGWGLSLVFVQALVALFASRRFAGRFFLAMNLCWFLSGFVLAYAMPAAGPVFAHLFDAGLAGRFDGLHAALATHLVFDGPILRTQAYLVSALGAQSVQIGSGISAMPSVHVTVAMLYVFAAQGMRWRAPAIVFAMLTFIGSVHFGYHYAVDGLVGAVVALVSWKVSTLYFAERSWSAGPIWARGAKPEHAAIG